MTFDWKKAFRALAITVCTVVFLGGGVLFLFLMGSLGMFPLYVTKVIPVVGAAAVIASMRPVSSSSPRYTATLSA